MSLFSERLRELRLEKGEVQAVVAKLLDVSLGSYSAYETGREPKYDVLCQLAKHYGVTTDYLIGHSDVKKVENVAFTEKLGLSEQSIEALKNCYERDKANSITMTINALLEQRYALGEISRYLYYIPMNVDSGSSVVPFQAVYRYTSKCAEQGFVEWSDNIKPPIDYELSLEAINTDLYKRLLLTKVDDQLKSLLDIENGKERI